MRASYDALKTALGVEKADKFAQETTKWVAQVDELVEQGRLLASTGGNRTSLEFDRLKQLAKTLGGNACTKFVNDFDLDVKQYKLSRIPDLEGKDVNVVKVSPEPSVVPNQPVISTGAKTESPKKKGATELGQILKKPAWANKEENEMQFAPVHRNFIGGLKPTPSWEILFDECGTNFSANATELAQSPESKDLGRVVAVLVPSYSHLPLLPPGFHCTDAGNFGKGFMEFSERRELRDKAVEQNLQRLLKNQCGVIGIPVSNKACLKTDVWLSCVGRVISLILRLLPIEEETILRVKVEQRGEFNAGKSEYLQAMCIAALQEMKLVFPERVGKIKIECSFIEKQDSSFNGYADCVAYAWGGSSKPHWTSVIRQTGWLDTCLLYADPNLMQHCLDLLQMKDVPSAEDWNALHRSSAGSSNNTFLDNTILYLLGERVQQNPELWRRYQEYTLSHLNSKAIDMRLLGRQVDWLKAWQPDESELSPRTRLLWLTIKLAEENHRGEVLSFSQLRDELQSLCERLYMEDAPLVCFAKLHLAVSFTDAFAFEKAKALLLPWAEKDPAIPGRRYYASVLSSLGQHEAFLGEQDKAVEYFQKAIQEFENLSDKDEASGEVGQTSAYLVTAMMDQAEVDYPALDQAMEKYLQCSLVEAARKLRSTKAPGNKYPHHIFLRYLMLPNAQAAAREEYLAGKKDWQVPADQGHPWELIEFYRGLLCEDVLEKRAHMRAACEIAKAGGPTLRLIAAAILGGILTFDNTVKEEYLALVEKVIWEIPNLGAEQCECLRNQPIALLSPLALMQKVLPFNFR